MYIIESSKHMRGKEMAADDYKRRIAKELENINSIWLLDQILKLIINIK